jgi:hypothetical protein
MLLPDPSALSSEDWALVDRLWDRVGRVRLKSLTEQLGDGDPFREQLDDGLLELVGIATQPERTRLAVSFRRGAFGAIRALRGAMGTGTNSTDIAEGDV